MIVRARARPSPAMPLLACFSSALPFRPASTTSTAKCTRKATRIVRACAERTTDASSPPSTKLITSEQQPLIRKSDTPAIFNGPEAVLAVLLAAAALLADFVQNVARLSAAGIQTLDLSAAESGVADLREALKISREVLDETEKRFNAVSEQRADVQNALVDADWLQEKMNSANLYAQSAQEQLQRVQNALNNVQQKRLHVAQEKERVDEERQRVETQIAEKRLLVDKLSEQIESAKKKEKEIMKQVKYQQQLLNKQLEQTRKQLSENVGDAEKKELEEKGGDSSRSEMSLQEIRRNLRAEKLALSAEIREARVATEALSEEVDKLQLLKSEMKAKRDGMRARLKKAQTTVNREEKEIQRREDAIGEILDSVDSDDEENVVTEGTAAIENTGTVKKRVRKGRKKEVVEKDVSAVEETEATAKKKKGRRSVAKDEVVEETQSAMTEVGVDMGEDSLKSEDDSVKAASTRTTKEVGVDTGEDSSKSEDDSVKAASTSTTKEVGVDTGEDSSMREDDSVKAASTITTKEVKKRTRTRKRADSGESSSPSAATRTRKSKATSKKSSEMNEDEPLTAKEAMDVRKAMLDLVGDATDVADLPDGGEGVTPGIVVDKKESAQFVHDEINYVQFQNVLLVPQNRGRLSLF
ncbi:GTPase regulator [Gracilaria domingensis]|nr:GTPase regulator [Gracilaria domingensis]